MLENLKREMNITYTENGAVAYKTSLSDCLDLFATIGALRNASAEEIVKRFIRAFTEKPDLAMKTLFFARDVRGGLGERRVFRIILDWLCRNQPETVIKNIGLIGEYGRYDDLLTLVDTPCEKAAMLYISDALKADIDAMEKGEEVSLLSKWMPSVNASNKNTIKIAKRIARSLGMSDADYRRTLVKLRAYIRIIENNLREKDYTFDYSKQPSKAMYKYRAAFMRNDGERYQSFLQKVNKGEAKLNTSTLYPYELIAPYVDELFKFGYNAEFMGEITEAEKLALNTTWENLPDYTNGENAIVVVDTSGSMYIQQKPTPASVALSLGIYFAERNKGAFKNHFIEFSEKPQLIELKGETFADRLRYILSFNEVANTNIEAVFDVILKAAVNNNVSQDELPSTLYIISDMEFDWCVENASQTVFGNAKEKYAAAGYCLPKVVFWNVASRNLHLPVTKNELGVALVSGCTPQIFDMITGGEINPEQCMLDILLSQRYAPVAA